jgi:2-polyprenyl-3-methyl-5-hydroxy-6-metoxy-1,4-benzoquinol methylase
MSESGQTLLPEYFDALYAADSDPWKFAASPYERDKYALTLDAMPKPRYRSALEIGCSIGVLTKSLASRCDALVAIDAAQTPLIDARRRCADLPGVRFEHMFVPEQWPSGDFELILLSEVVYYFSREDVGRLAARVADSVAKDGSVILVCRFPLRSDPGFPLRTDPG